MIKIGLDLHGVINTDWEFFSELTKIIIFEGGIYPGDNQVHILTGSSDSLKVREELRDNQIYYTHFFSITDWCKSKGVPVEYGPDGTPWADDYWWDRAKGDYAREQNLDLVLDDSGRYFDFFTTPVARYFSKSERRAKRPPAIPEMKRDEPKPVPNRKIEPYF